jgi:hypothetical protein
MVKLAEDLQGKFNISLQSPSRVSRIAATLHIMQCQVCGSTSKVLVRVRNITQVEQCTIIATRPIMFVLVKQRLAASFIGPPAIETVSESVIALLKSCVGAATTIIRILSILHEQDLVGLFTLLEIFGRVTKYYRAVFPTRPCRSFLRWLYSYSHIHSVSLCDDR